jgi:DHA1 family bicyclomycin/chloramphenicol resistance-like MFS transporter
VTYVAWAPLHFVISAVAMVFSILVADGTALPMAGGIAICAFLAFAVTQATIGRRAAVAAAE